MRSFTPKTILIASLLSALPLAGAYARSSALDEVDQVPSSLHGTRLAAVLNQAQGVEHGITDARQGHEITAGQARELEMRADGVANTARHMASADHGRISSARYHQLLRRLDNVDQKLRVDTGSGVNMGDGSDGGNYPNG
ncbi:MAG: hypothetical protein J0I98_07430 [Mesorhizobium sp.]|nr:hypothetical protein [Mesorhizobium sp.]MBN9242608.1 hypothetical protein [Mesorhizobium sp.]